MANQPGLSWGPAHPVNAMRTSRGWGSFADAAEFQDADFAERLREEVSADDVTFTMAALH